MARITTTYQPIHKNTISTQLTHLRDLLKADNNTVTNETEASTNTSSTSKMVTQETSSAAENKDSSPPAIQYQFGVKSDGGNLVPDTIGVADKTSLLVMTNYQVWYYAKDAVEGDQITQSLSGFCADGLEDGPESLSAVDPYIVRDPLSNQYVYLAMNRSSSEEPGLFVGATTDGKLDGDWKRTWLSMEALGYDNSYSFDYPRIGTNSDFITIAVDLKKNGTKGYLVIVMDKISFYQDDDVIINVFLIEETVKKTFVPARTFDEGIPQYLISTDKNNTINEDGDAVCSLEFAKIYGSFEADNITMDIFYSEDIDFPYDTKGESSNLGPQKGTDIKLFLGALRMQSAVYRNGSLWCTHVIYKEYEDGKYNTGIQAYETNPESTDDLVIQTLRYYDTNGEWFYAFPSIAVNAVGDILIGMAAFNEDVYPQGTYTYRYSTDPLGELRLVGSIVESDSYFESRTDSGGRYRWGDYSNTIVDPVDETSFWTTQEIALTDEKWETKWIKIAPAPYQCDVMSGGASDIETKLNNALSRDGNISVYPFIDVSYGNNNNRLGLLVRRDFTNGQEYNGRFLRGSQNEIDTDLGSLLSTFTGDSMKMSLDFSNDKNQLGLLLSTNIVNLKSPYKYESYKGTKQEVQDGVNVSLSDAQKILGFVYAYGNQKHRAFAIWSSGTSDRNYKALIKTNENISDLTDNINNALQDTGPILAVSGLNIAYGNDKNHVGMLLELSQDSEDGDNYCVAGVSGSRSAINNYLSSFLGNQLMEVSDISLEYRKEKWRFIILYKVLTTSRGYDYCFKTFSNDSSDKIEENITNATAGVKQVLGYAYGYGNDKHRVVVIWK